MLVYYFLEKDTLLYIGVVLKIVVYAFRSVHTMMYINAVTYIVETF